MTVYLPDGNGGFARKKPGRKDVIRRSASGEWSVVFSNGVAETYKSDGYIRQITYANGKGYHFLYTGVNHLAEVRNTADASIKFLWENEVVRGIEDPEGHFYRYNYVDGFLDAVISPGDNETVQSPGDNPQIRKYHRDASNRYTGESFNGERYSVNTFDSNSAVQSSGLAGNVEFDSFVYEQQSQTEKSTTVTDERGGKTKFSYKKFGDDEFKVSSIEQEATGGTHSCSAKSGKYEYDASGFPLSYTDSLGKC